MNIFCNKILILELFLMQTLKLATMNSTTDAQNALHQIDDKLFKITFQTRDALLAFMERYLPEHLLKHIDLEALELDITEYVNKDLRKFQSFTAKTKEAAMTTYEQVVLKNQALGEAMGDKLRILKIIWTGMQQKVSIEMLAGIVFMTPLLVKKWMNWMQIMLQEDEKGSSSTIIAAKINEAGADPNISPNEVQKLLVFLKTPLPQIVKKTRTRKAK